MQRIYYILSEKNLLFFSGRGADHLPPALIGDMSHKK